MLRLGYDAFHLFNNFTGPGNYSRTLISNLAYYYPDFGYFLYARKITRRPETQFFLSSPVFSVHHPQRMDLMARRAFPQSADLKKHKIQLFHGLANALPVGLTDMTATKTVVTIHDLVHKQFPDFFPSLKRIALEEKIRYACDEADHLIATSESTKKDLMRFYRLPSEKISVVYQSCNERFFQDKSPAILKNIREAYRLPEQFMLFVGELSPRKNLLSAVRALELLPPSVQIPLVVVGSGRHYKTKVLRYVRRKGLQKLVRFLTVSDQDLPAIFQNASLFIYPSRYEGFGIPLLEAALSKIPILTSRVASIPEVVGHGAHLVDPLDITQISDGIERLLTDDPYRQNLIHQSLRHVQQFHGEKVTEQLVDVYEQVLGMDLSSPAL